MMGLYVNFEPERIWKDVVMAYFKALYRNLSGGTDIHENLSQDSRFRGSVEPGTFRIRRRRLTTRLWCLVMLSGVMELFFFILVNTVSATVIFEVRT
jgi:hypothetical protein